MAVVTIFKGPEKSLFIENDEVPMGATVRFTNDPDLQVIAASEMVFGEATATNVIVGEAGR